MDCERSARSADELDYWTEREHDSFHYVYFHTESCDGHTHTVTCNKPEYHKVMFTLETCTDSCTVNQRENFANNADVGCHGETSTKRRLQGCDTEQCNGYMHIVTCISPAQHDQKASFFLCNDHCEVYQQRKRKLEKRMTTPAVPEQTEYLEPDVNEVDIPLSQQDTVILDGNTASISDDIWPEASHDSSFMEENNTSNTIICDPEGENAMDTDEWLKQKTPEKTQPPTPESLKATRRRERKRKNEATQKKQKCGGKKRVQDNGQAIFFIIEEAQEVSSDNGESESDA